MRKPLRTLGPVVLFCAAASVHAEDDFGFAARAGTLGLGIELSRELGPFQLRFGFNSFTYRFSEGYSDIGYDAELGLESTLLVLDWRPARGGFRIGGGVVRNDNTVDAPSAAVASYSLGGTTYSGDEVGDLTAAVRFDDYAPYGGIGWDTWIGDRQRIGLSLDFGVVLQGSPRATLRAVDGSSLSGDPSFQAALAEEERQLQSEIDAYEYYPAAALGLVFRF